MHRPTWVEVDLNAVSGNIKNVRKLVDDNTIIIAIVKANAYGHGIINISKRLEMENVDMFGVATVEDGVKLRDNGITKPVLILGCILPEQIGTILKSSLTPAIVSLDMAKKISERVEQLLNDKIAVTDVNVHVKIDTGMGGFGVCYNDAVDEIREIDNLNHINIEGIFTHFTSSDSSDKDSVNEQVKRFKDVISRLEKYNIHIPIKHFSNSSAVIQIPLTLNAIRPGISIYGMYTSKNVPKSANLQEVMSFKTTIVNIKKLKKGETVSYNRTFKVERDSLIATLPVGYSDGYSRALSNKGRVIVRGKNVPVAGIVRMDFTYVDVTDVQRVSIGDEVVLFGKQGEEIISIESIADLAGLIPYEITCAIGADVPRIYK